MILLIAKVIDDFLIAGGTKTIDNFLTLLHNAFELGKIGKEPKLKFLGCELVRNNKGDIYMHMDSYIRSISHIELPKHRITGPFISASEIEIRLFCSLADIILYAGQAILPQGCMVPS